MDRADEDFLLGAAQHDPGCRGRPARRARRRRGRSGLARRAQPIGIDGRVAFGPHGSGPAAARGAGRRRHRNRSARCLGTWLNDPTLDSEGVQWRARRPSRAARPRSRRCWRGTSCGGTSPGRLRPCANDECQLFLIDHSKPNRARWCSMAVCGNRLKARRHYERTRDRDQPGGTIMTDLGDSGVLLSVHVGRPRAVQTRREPVADRDLEAAGRGPGRGARGQPRRR